MEKRKRGNPNMKKGAPSVNPRGSGAPRLWIQKEVQEAVKKALEDAHPDGPAGYFTELARKKPELFIGMVQKIMPNETAVNVTVSLGDAMAEAQRRIEEYEKKLIDITPNASDDKLSD